MKTFILLMRIWSELVWNTDDRERGGERGGGANTRTPAIKEHRPFNPGPDQPLGNAGR